VAAGSVEKGLGFGAVMGERLAEMAEANRRLQEILISQQAHHPHRAGNLEVLQKVAVPVRHRAPFVADH